MNRAAFFAAVRGAPFSGSLSQGQVNGMTAILDEWDRRKLDDVRWLAYMLATAFHETARTMQPIREYGEGRGTRYGTTFYGRGFVQLTWEANYRKASAVVGVDLLADPDRALEMPIAAAILADGMTKGWFTGHKLADYVDGRACDYVEARRVINGTDRAVTIAGYAVSFERALAAAAFIPASLPTRDQPVIVAAPPKPPPQRPFQPDDPGVEPSQKPASGGLSHVGTVAAGATAAGVIVATAQTAGVTMWTIAAFIAGVAIGLILPYLGKIKAALTADPMPKPAPKSAQAAPSPSKPVQAVAPQSSNASPAPPAANTKG